MSGRFMEQGEARPKASAMRRIYDSPLYARISFKGHHIVQRSPRDEISGIPSREVFLISTRDTQTLLLPLPINAAYSTQEDAPRGWCTTSPPPCTRGKFLTWKPRRPTGR